MYYVTQKSNLHFLLGDLLSENTLYLKACERYLLLEIYILVTRIVLGINSCKKNPIIEYEKIQWNINSNTKLM